MPYHTPEAKTELAFKRILETYSETDLAGVQLIQRFSPEDIVTPSISIIVAKCTPEDTGEGPSGNWTCEIEITLRSHYKDNTVAEHDGWLGCVTDLVCDKTLVDTLNAVMLEEQFTAMEWEIGPRTHAVEGSIFVSKVEGTLYMFPSKGE